MEKLVSNDLKKRCDVRMFNFKTTEEIEYIEDIIAQPRYEKSMEVGLNIKSDNFNIFVLGEDGLGKLTYTKKYVKEIALKESKMEDIAYVNNFEDKLNPKALKIPSGVGKEFAKEMKYVIKSLIDKLPNLLTLESLERKRDKIILEFQNMRDAKVLELTKITLKHDTVIKTNKEGIFLLPVVDSVTLFEEDIEKLEEEKRIELTNKMEIAYELIEDEIFKISKLERNAYKEINKYEYTEYTLIIGSHFSNIVNKYAEIKSISDYLKEVKNNLVKTLMNLYDVRSGNINQESEIEIINKYKVNVVVDNSRFGGAPVIFVTDASLQSLVGEVEYEYEFGNLTTDFNKISAGSLQKANGGYLIISAYDLLSNRYSYDVIKRVLETKVLDYEMLKEFAGFNKLTINITPIELNIKVIIVGTYEEYYTLDNYDVTFKDKFKIVGEFDNVMEYNVENLGSVVKIVKKFVVQDKLQEVTREGLCEIVEHSTRISEDQKKLTTKFNKIQSLLIEANYYAIKERSEVICKKHIIKAINEKLNRYNSYEKDIDEYIDKNVIMINTEDERVGEINGLSILETGEYSFGKPNKITVTTYGGETGILNIEKESDLSGKIHDKGVNIVNGYLGEKYATDFPLTLSCRICFEQSYGEIEGDSASSAELYGIISSLSEVPIKQCIAVTGSVNQKGEIQAVGSVTHKIEGFYNLCKKRGLTGEEGVVMPYQNIKNLVLKDDVCESVEKGEFNIYAIKTIDEGIEILTGEKAGEMNNKGNYEKNTIHDKVLRKLRKLSKI